MIKQRHFPGVPANACSDYAGNLDTAAAAAVFTKSTTHLMPHDRPQRATAGVRSMPCC
jgi:hypothetical protein